MKKRAHVIGDIQHQSLAIESGAYFDGRSVRSATSNVPVQTERRAAGAALRSLAPRGCGERAGARRRSCRLGKALLLKGTGRLAPVLFLARPHVRAIRGFASIYQAVFDAQLEIFPGERQPVAASDPTCTGRRLSVKPELVAVSTAW